ncbi:MAG: ribokinase [Fimbriimonadaceae bacterium]
MSSRCWVIGSAVLDTVYSVDRLPQPGESVLAHKVEQFLGGKGVNQAIACVRSDAETRIICQLGSDHSHLGFMSLFERENLITNKVFLTNKDTTGHAAITIDAVGNNQISVYPGANMLLPAKKIDQSKIEKSDFTLCQFEVPDDVIIAASKRGNFILNPAPYREFPREVLQSCFAITPNETEAAALTRIHPDTDSNLEKCADKLLESGVQNVIITLGERGAFFKNVETSKHYPAPKVKAIDTTAAGDVFNGALIARLSLGDTFDKAIPYAIAAASISVTKPGAVPSIPNKQKVIKFLSARNS